MQTSPSIKSVRPSGATPAGGVKALMHSLRDLGITSKAVSEVLPPWWENSIADDPAGLTELKVILARRFSLDPTTLFVGAEKIDFLPVLRRYKGVRDDLVKKLGASTGIASALCRTALSFVEEQKLSHFKDPVALRESIIASGAANVGLTQLLDVCWAAQVPVLHVTLPAKLSKFDALVTSNAGRYAVALCRNEDSEAWLAFHLAHEMGHIACGHLEGDGMLVDEKIEASTAKQEQEANDYAAKLLGSDGLSPPQLSYKVAATAAKFVAAATANNVLPGHLVLKAGMLGSYLCARAVLKHVEPSPRARQLINERTTVELGHRWTYDADEFISQFFCKTEG